MKALSKRRGRPKAENVIRESNGRISRAKEPPSKLALEARARMTGLSIERAHDQQAGQWLGRLHMAYQTWHRQERASDKPQPSMSISTSQYHALLSYQTLHNNYLKAVGAPGAVYDGAGGMGLGDEDAAETWARHCKGKHKAARDAIQEAQNGCPGNLWAALDYCVIQEQQMPHMIGDLRVLANAMAVHFNGKGRG
jgi:hypothetical protein